MRITKAIRNEQLQRLKEVYGDTRTALNYTNPFTFLVAVMLSAQCTDARVNVITSRIFPRLDSPEKMIELSLPELENEIRDCGLYHAKAKHLLGTCQMLLDQYGGEVPRDFDELTEAAGGRAQDGQCSPQRIMGISGYCRGYSRIPGIQPVEAGCGENAAGGGGRTAESHSHGGLVCCASLAHLAWKKSLPCQKAGL